MFFYDNSDGIQKGFLTGLDFSQLFFARREILSRRHCQRFHAIERTPQIWEPRENIKYQILIPWMFTAIALVYVNGLHQWSYLDWSALHTTNTLILHMIDTTDIDSSKESASFSALGRPILPFTSEQASFTKLIFQKYRSITLIILYSMYALDLLWGLSLLSSILAIIPTSIADDSRNPHSQNVVSWGQNGGNVVENNDLSAYYTSNLGIDIILLEYSGILVYSADRYCLLRSRNIDTYTIFTTGTLIL